MTAQDVVVYDMDGHHVEGVLNPSSELPLHIAVYQATDAKAITHNHAYASTALGLVVDEIPPSHYYSTMFGGVVRVAPYAAFGTDQLAKNVAAALEGRTGALMRTTSFAAPPSSATIRPPCIRSSCASPMSAG